MRSSPAAAARRAVAAACWSPKKPPRKKPPRKKPAAQDSRQGAQASPRGEAPCAPLTAELDRILEELRADGISVSDGFVPMSAVRALADCAALRRSRGEFLGARIGADSSLQRREDVRGDLICWLAGEQFPAETQLLAALEQLRLGLNERAYLGLVDLEVHYAWYPPGAALCTPCRSAAGPLGTARLGGSLPQRAALGRRRRRLEGSGRRRSISRHRARRGPTGAVLVGIARARSAAHTSPAAEPDGVVPRTRVGPLAGGTTGSRCAGFVQGRSAAPLEAAPAGSAGDTRRRLPQLHWHEYCCHQLLVRLSRHALAVAQISQDLSSRGPAARASKRLPKSCS